MKERFCPYLNCFYHIIQVTKKDKKKEPKEPKELKKESKAAEKTPTAAEEETDATEEALAAEPKKKNPFASMPKSSFDLDDFKRFYSNEDEAKSIPYFWQKFDAENYSIWFSEYKYNNELTKVCICFLEILIFERIHFEYFFIDIYMYIIYIYIYIYIYICVCVFIYTGFHVL